MPGAQSAQLVDPETAEYDPGAQGVHTLDPPKAEYDPGAQGVQMLAPASEKVEAPHVMQLAEPAAEIKVPAEQSVQVPAPTEENLPMLQLEHDDEVTAPLEPENKPATQLEQLTAELLLW